MFHALYNTARRTLTMTSDWLPGETQLLAVLREITFSMEALAHLDPEMPELEPLIQDTRETLELTASYIRAMHDILPSPVPAPAVLSIATLIQQDLDVIDSVYTT